MADLPAGTITFLFIDIEGGGGDAQRGDMSRKREPSRALGERSDAGGRALWPRSGQRRGKSSARSGSVLCRAAERGEKTDPGTRLWEQHPEAMSEALARHDTLPRQ